jgi:hypothetical protein
MSYLLVVPLQLILRSGLQERHAKCGGQHGLSLCWRSGTGTCGIVVQSRPVMLLRNVLLISACIASSTPASPRRIQSANHNGAGRLAVHALHCTLLSWSQKRSRNTAQSIVDISNKPPRKYYTLSSLHPRPVEFIPPFALSYSCLLPDKSRGRHNAPHHTRFVARRGRSCSACRACRKVPRLEHQDGKADAI